MGGGKDCPTGPGPGRTAALPQLVLEVPEGTRGAGTPWRDLAWGHVIPGALSERMATNEHGKNCSRLGLICHGCCLGPGMGTGMGKRALGGQAPHGPHR